VIDLVRDEVIRSSAFAFLRTVQLRTGGPVRFDDVSTFVVDGNTMALLDRQRGIRKPALLDGALSFRTVHAPRPDRRPYDDEAGSDGYLRYKYRGENPDHPENLAMRQALTYRLPLIWFQGIDTGLYLPVFPVWLVSEERALLQFVVALDMSQLEGWDASTPDERPLLRRYNERVVRDRLHQPLFRQRVLAAYEQKCAVCRLRHVALLDAAHVKGDADNGEPIVPNGIAMCKLHHAAFDASLMGIDSDYVVHIRPDVRAEEDGPTLRYALQGVHGRPLEVPKRRAARPDRDLLAERFTRFLEAS
jgi:putative restriction endonuclease